MIKLLNVTDTRTNKFHSVAIVSEDKVKYFIHDGEKIDVKDMQEKAEAFDILLGEDNV